MDPSSLDLGLMVSGLGDDLLVTEFMSIRRGAMQQHDSLFDISDFHSSITSPLASRSRTSASFSQDFITPKPRYRRKSCPTRYNRTAASHRGLPKKPKAVQKSVSYPLWPDKFHPEHDAAPVFVEQTFPSSLTLSLQANLKFQTAAWALTQTKFSPARNASSSYPKYDLLPREIGHQYAPASMLIDTSQDAQHKKTRLVRNRNLDKRREIPILEKAYELSMNPAQSMKIVEVGSGILGNSTCCDPFESDRSGTRAYTEFEKKLHKASRCLPPKSPHLSSENPREEQFGSNASSQNTSVLQVLLTESHSNNLAKSSILECSNSRPVVRECAETTCLRQRSPNKDVGDNASDRASSSGTSNRHVPPESPESWDTRYVGIPTSNDTALIFKRWEVWLQRLLWGIFIFGANTALVFAFFLASRHQYLFAILLFIKSKDLLSTIAGVLAMLYKNTHKAIWTPRHSKPLWIMTLVTAYAETEEQILKTVMSLNNQKCEPHRQVVCIILDGKPRDVLSHFSTITYQKRRPYTTWRSARMEIQICAGFMANAPVIVIQKLRNAGKKDSLILGHDLFNYLRENAPFTTKILREEIQKSVIPTLVFGTPFTSFDTIFCTDADSVVHEDALKHLANALSRDSSAIAACGMLLAELTNDRHEWGIWHLFQQFQYTFGQYVRRQAEGTWGRVTCLPGVVTMIAVRPEMAAAVDEYARPITDHNLVRHQVQYLGTDRRLTWCMLSQYKHLRSLFVPEAMSETVVPTTLSHYLSQRRRWASNAYFNDFFYAFGPQQRLITRLFSSVEVLRLTLVFYRVFNTGLFIHSLATRWHILKIVATLVVTKTPVMWYLVLVLFNNPVLRKRAHKLVLGMCINQVISPILSVVVFANVILNLGTQVWGKTGVSSRIIATPQKETAHQRQTPMPGSAHRWTPKSLATIVRAVVGKQKRDDAAPQGPKVVVQPELGIQPPGRAQDISNLTPRRGKSYANRTFLGRSNMKQE